MAKNKKTLTMKSNPKTQNNQKDSALLNAETIAKGATVVSLAAGVVAAGVYLSGKANRKKASQLAAKGMSVAQDLATEGKKEFANRYQSFAMTIPSKRTKKAKFEAKKR